MLVEAYLTMFELVVNYSELEAWLIISFLFSIGAFILSVLGTFLIRPMKKKNPKLAVWFVQFILVQAVAIAFSAFELLYYGVSDLGWLMLFSLHALYVYIALVLPLGWLYRRILAKYPVVPWHLLQYLMCLIGSLIFWAFAIYVAQVFLWV